MYVAHQRQAENIRANQGSKSKGVSENNQFAIILLKASSSTAPFVSS